jgi:hypothetical protein
MHRSIEAGPTGPASVRRSRCSDVGDLCGDTTRVIRFCWLMSRSEDALDVALVERRELDGAGR